MGGLVSSRVTLAKILSKMQVSDRQICGLQQAIWLKNEKFQDVVW